MIKIGNFLFFLIILFFSIAGFAATSVQSSVDRNEMGLGDTFNLTVAISSSDEVDIQEPRVPELDGFDLLNNWESTAVSQKLVETPKGMQFQTQRRKEFHFTLSPKRTGTLSVSSFEAIVDGKVYRTQPIVIKVDGTGQGAIPKRPSQRPAAPGSEDPFEAMDRAEEEMFGQLLRQRQQMLQQLGRQLGAPFPDEQPGGVTGLPNAAFRSQPKNPNEAFFIGVEVDKTEVFEGEQVTVNWYIYTRGAMETLDRLKFPSLKGFWKEIIEEVPGIQFYEEQVQGIPWKKALLASHALFPIKPGTAVIDEYKIKSRVRMMTQGLGGFYGKPYEYTKSSARIEIKVKPLPTEGRPSDFTGAVGQFEVQATVENNTVPVNQPVSLRVRFEGAGNAKLIDLPAIEWPTGLEQYDSKSTSKFFKNGRSFKEFELLVIPRQEGELKIPALSVGMFDPQTKKYYSRSTQPIVLNVTNNPNAPVGSSSRLSDKKKPEPSMKPSLVLPGPILEWSSAAETSNPYRSWVWILVYGVSSAALLWKAQREFGWGRRRRSLKDLVQRRYKVLESALEKNDFRKVGVEMTNIFYVILGELAGTGGASQEISRLLELIPPSIRREYGSDIAKSFELFQTLSFAPEEMLGNLKAPERLKAEITNAQKLIASVLSSIEDKA